MIIKTKRFYEAVYAILVELGNANPRDKNDFVRAFMDVKYPSTEWLFGGLLGGGGKYRSRNVVNTYQESETPERLRLIEKINKRLAEIPRNVIIYVDMDGVIADFEAEIKKVHPTIFDNPDEDEYRGKVIDEICENDVNIFARLQPINGAIEAVNELQKHFEVYFLSTPMWGVPHSFTDKRLWIDQYFGKSAEKRLILSHRKDLNIGDFLIDDRLKNGAESFTGTHIHFATKDFPNWSSVIHYFTKLHEHADY